MAREVTREDRGGLRGRVGRFREEGGEGGCQGKTIMCVGVGGVREGLETMGIKRKEVCKKQHSGME